MDLFLRLRNPAHLELHKTIMTNLNRLKNSVFISLGLGVSLVAIVMLLVSAVSGDVNIK